MSDKIVTVGIWESAPFGASILRGLERLNEFLKSENLAVRYEPVRLNHKKLPNINKTPDILILDGGEDVNPARYNQRNTHSMFNDARDDAEFALVNHFDMYGKKMSGVCRGHQLLNVHYGGTLIQDIRASGMYTEKALSYHKGGHKVRLKRPQRAFRSYGGYSSSSKKLRSSSNKKRGHIISRFVGVNPFTVSSMHHQAVKNLGNNLGVSLSFGGKRRGRYYIVEGIESSDGRIRGVQSHPEFNGYPKDGVIFSYLMHIDTYVDNLFEPDMDEVKARLEAEKGPTKPLLPFDMQNYPPEPARRRNRDEGLQIRATRAMPVVPPEEAVTAPNVTAGNIAVGDTANFTVTANVPPIWEIQPEDDNGTNDE
jgi:putative glutamine amidotransferase